MTCAAPSHHNPTLCLPDLHLQLLRVAVPERAAELLQLVKAANVQIVQASDKAGFQLETAFGAIVVGHRAPAASWIVTLAAWKCMAAYSPALLLMSGRLASADIANMPGQTEHVATIFRYLAAARDLLTAPDVAAFAWPAEVPQPVLHPASQPDQLVRDIAHLAWAFMLLHEIKHAELEASGTRPADPIEEERMCDAFAIAFLIDQTDRYAAESGKPAELVRDLRAMSVMTGLFIIALLECEGASHHPPAQERFDLLLRHMDGKPVKWFVLYAAVLLLGALDAREREFEIADFALDCEGLSALRALL